MFWRIRGGLPGGGAGSAVGPAAVGLGDSWKRGTDNPHDLIFGGFAHDSAFYVWLSVRACALPCSLSKQQIDSMLARCAHARRQGVIQTMRSGGAEQSAASVAKVGAASFMSV